MPLALSGSLILSGSFSTTGAITMSGSIASSSFATTASNANTASYVISSVTDTTQNTRLTTIEAVTGSFATTGSNQFNGNQTITGSLTATGTIVAQTLIVQTITSSIDFVTGSARFGSTTGNTHQFTGSLLVSGSGAFVGSLILSSTIGNGTYTYTLPSATGTLALTSQLSSYLPLSGGTLTGALSGTSASFSGNVNAQGGLLLTTAQTISTAGSMGFQSSVGTFIFSKAGINFDFRLYNGSALTVMSIPTGTQNVEFAGAATFSNSVDSLGLRANGSSGFGGSGVGVEVGWSGSIGYVQAYNRSTSAYQPMKVDGSTLSFQISGSEKLGIASTGAATFSSSVTAGGRITTNGGSGNGILVNAFNSTTNLPTNGLSLNTGFNVGYITNYSPNGVLADLYYGASKHIFTDGNVGIGTTAPNKKVEISTANAVNDGIRITYNNVTSEGLDITYLNSGATTINFDSIYNSNSAIMQFRMKTNGAALTALAILGNGNVGIGTTAPSYKLEIVGGVGTNQPARFESITTNLYTAYRANGVDVGYIGNGVGVATGGSATDFGFNSTANMVFSTVGAAERMRITSAGNVLIGTTTDATGKLQVNGSVYATSFFESSSVAYKNILATNPITALNVDVIKYKRTNVDVDDVRYGYSAEQINSLMPELTNKDATAVKYLDVHTLLIAELQREIKELKAKLN